MERLVLTVIVVAVVGGLIALLRRHLGKRAEAQADARAARLDAMDAAEKAASQRPAE